MYSTVYDRIFSGFVFSSFVKATDIFLIKILLLRQYCFIVYSRHNVIIDCWSGAELDVCKNHQKCPFHHFLTLEKEIFYDSQSHSIPYIPCVFHDL